MTDAAVRRVPEPTVITTTSTITRERQSITPWRRFPADVADWFSKEDVDKSKAYNGPIRRLGRIAKAASLAGDTAIVVLGLGPWLADHAPGNSTNWWLQLLTVTIGVTLFRIATRTPVHAYRALVYDKRWGFSKQTPKSFAIDMVKSIGIGLVISTLLATAMWAVIRATPLWWFWGFVLMLVFQVGLGVLYPVLIDPIFNKFKSLEDGELRDELLALADELGSGAKDVLVADASKRDSRQNAYVSGMGKTKRIVIFDTMLEQPREQLRSIVAHELGHYSLKHIPKSVAVYTPLLLVQFVLLYLVLTSGTVLDIAGVTTLGDPAAYPLFGLAFGLIGMLTAVPESYWGRSLEREADIFSLDATKDPASFVAAMRSLHTENVSDLTPSTWERLTSSHPQVEERMAMGVEWGEQHGMKVPAA